MGCTLVPTSVRFGMGSFKDITGQRFGRLVVVAMTETVRNGQKTWLCQCDCGATSVVRGGPLRQGVITSCGCWQGARHGHARRDTPRHPLYSVWKRMRQRCSDPNSTDFKYYGGRGITVCKRWNDFPTFLSDVGPRPHGMTIDRLNSDGNYEPGNIRWAARAQQSQNRRPRS